MTRILGIDPASACGWAVLDGDGNRLASGVLDVSIRRGEGEGMRYLRARRAFQEMLAAYPDAVVVYEEVRHHAGNLAGQVYGGLVGHLVAVCAEMGRQYTLTPVATIKRHATGRGNAKKPEMVAAANARWAPHVVADDNEADALWIADTYRVGKA